MTEGQSWVVYRHRNFQYLFKSNTSKYVSKNPLTSNFTHPPNLYYISA